MDPRGAVDAGALPERFREPAREMAQRIVARYPNTVAILVIGSVALGSWDDESDVDLVWVLRGRRRKRWYEEIEYHFEGLVELVPLTLSELRRHFALSSPLAHSIARGIPLYDPEGLLPALRGRRLGQPKREWMEEWYRFFSQRLDWGLDLYRRERESHRRFCRDRCICHVSEILTRAVVNLARVLLALAGLVPTSKVEMRAEYPKVIRGARLRRAMETALQAHHQKRDLTLPEAAELAHLGRWLRGRLARLLEGAPLPSQGSPSPGGQGCRSSPTSARR